MHASKPTTTDNLQYHTHTGPGDIAEFCLFVGAQGRAKMIAEIFFTSDYNCFENEHRGLLAYTGYYKGVRVSVATSGMGGPSAGIIMPELARCGARVIIRVGSCGSLVEESKPGESIIVDSALRYDGASNNWVSPDYPLMVKANDRVVWALIEAAQKVNPSACYVGQEATTGCFNAGQGRPDIYGNIPPHMLKRHEDIMEEGEVFCYSMEAATVFTWCLEVGLGMPAGAINAIYANRHTGEWGTIGDEEAARIAIEAIVLLSTDVETLETINNINVPYSV